MAITFSIPDTEVLMTSPQVGVLCQDLVNSIREFEDDFQMMSNPHILDAEGKVSLGGSVFTEIVVKVLYPWTLRFELEASQHTEISGGTIVALDAGGAKRPLTTNPSLTIAQSISGTLVETGVSGLTPTESAELSQTAADVAIIKAQTGAIFVKNQPFANFMFPMTDASGALLPGLTVTGAVCLDDGAWAPTVNTPAEISTTGQYRIDLAAADLNGDIASLRFTAPGAVPRNITIVTTS